MRKWGASVPAVDPAVPTSVRINNFPRTKEPELSQGVYPRYPRLLLSLFESAVYALLTTNSYRQRLLNSTGCLGTCWHQRAKVTTLPFNVHYTCSTSHSQNFELPCILVEVYSVPGHLVFYVDTVLLIHKSTALTSLPREPHHELLPCGSAPLRLHFH